MESDQLMKFYMGFLPIRFAQLAYHSDNESRVLLNELHVFARIAPEIMSPMVAGIARMGGKEATSIDLVSQEKDEIETLEAGVLNQMSHKQLLYRGDGHDELADRLGIQNETLRERWKYFRDPSGTNWRPGIKVAGDETNAFNLFLTFPSEHIDLCGTQKTDLMYKKKIEASTNDPFERLKLLKRAKEVGNVDFI